MNPDVPPLRSVVELRPDLEKFYNGAQAGWRGTVKDHKVDDGFDLIYVEWDRNHWRYEPEADQADGWTYPAHFKVVGQLNTTPEEFAAEMVAYAQQQTEKEDAPECEHCGGNHSEDDRMSGYLEALHEAASIAAEGEGFALFFVQKEEDENSYTIRPYMTSACLTDEAQALIEAQIVRVAEMCSAKFMVEYLKKFSS